MNRTEKLQAALEKKTAEQTKPLIEEATFANIPEMFLKSNKRATTLFQRAAMLVQLTAELTEDVAAMKDPITSFSSVSNKYFKSDLLDHSIDFLSRMISDIEDNRKAPCPGCPSCSPEQFEGLQANVFKGTFQELMQHIRSTLANKVAAEEKAPEFVASSREEVIVN